MSDEQSNDKVDQGRSQATLPTVGVGAATGAGLGIAVGVAIAGGIGVAFGVFIGAGLGVIAGSVFELIRKRRRPAASG